MLIKQLTDLFDMQEITPESLRKTNGVSISRMVNRRAQAAANGVFSQYRDAIWRELERKFKNQNPNELTLANWLAELTDDDIRGLASDEKMGMTRADFFPDRA